MRYNNKSHQFTVAMWVFSGNTQHRKHSHHLLSKFAMKLCFIY